MKNSKKIITLIAGLLFISIQFIQSNTNNQTREQLHNQLLNSLEIPNKVEAILNYSCFDCHSNSTNYPWYANVQPFQLLMNNHILEGKKNLNFSEFSTYSKRKQRNKLESIKKQITNDEMPLFSYTLLHRDAILQPEQKKEIINWINSVNQED